MKLISVSAYLLLASLSILGCGGSGSSKKAVSKGNVIKLNAIQQKTLSSNISTGKKGVSDVNTRASKKQSGSLNYSAGVSDWLWTNMRSQADQAMAYSTSSSSSSSPDLLDLAAPMNYNENFSSPCGETKEQGSMSIKASINIDVNQAKKQATMKVGLGAGFDNCVAGDAILNGNLSFDVGANLSDSKANISIALDGSTKAKFSEVENAPASEHEFQANGLEYAMTVDRSTYQKMESIQAEADNAVTPEAKRAAEKKLAEFMMDQLECSGSVVLVGQEFDCADIVKTSLAAGLMEEESSSSGNSNSNPSLNPSVDPGINPSLPGFRDEEPESPLEDPGFDNR